MKKTNYACINDTALFIIKDVEEFKKCFKLHNRNLPSSY